MASDLSPLTSTIGGSSAWLRRELEAAEPIGRPQVWRAIRGPVEQWPLALLDARTIAQGDVHPTALNIYDNSPGGLSRRGRRCHHPAARSRLHGGAMAWAWEPWHMGVYGGAMPWHIWATAEGGAE